MHVDLIKLSGSMELAPLVGLADAIIAATAEAENATEDPARTELPSRGDTMVQAKAGRSCCTWNISLKSLTGALLPST